MTKLNYSIFISTLFSNSKIPWNSNFTYYFSGSINYLTLTLQATIAAVGRCSQNSEVINWIIITVPHDCHDSLSNKKGYLVFLQKLVYNTSSLSLHPFDIRYHYIVFQETSTEEINWCSFCHFVIVNRSEKLETMRNLRKQIYGFGFHIAVLFKIKQLWCQFVKQTGFKNNQLGNKKLLLFAFNK